MLVPCKWNAIKEISKISPKEFIFWRDLKSYFQLIIGPFYLIRSYKASKGKWTKIEAGSSIHISGEKWSKLCEKNYIWAINTIRMDK